MDTMPTDSKGPRPYRHSLCLCVFNFDPHFQNNIMHMDLACVSFEWEMNIVQLCDENVSTYIAETGWAILFAKSMKKKTNWILAAQYITFMKYKHISIVLHNHILLFVEGEKKCLPSGLMVINCLASERTERNKKLMFNLPYGMAFNNCAEVNRSQLAESLRLLCNTLADAILIMTVYYAC